MEFLISLALREIKKFTRFRKSSFCCCLLGVSLLLKRQWERHLKGYKKPWSLIDEAEEREATVVPETSCITVINTQWTGFPLQILTIVSCVYISSPCNTARGYVLPHSVDLLLGSDH